MNLQIWFHGSSTWILSIVICISDWQPLWNASRSKRRPSRHLRCARLAADLVRYRWASPPHGKVLPDICALAHGDVPYSQVCVVKGLTCKAAWGFCWRWAHSAAVAQQVLLAQQQQQQQPCADFSWNANHTSTILSRDTYLALLAVQCVCPHECAYCVDSTIVRIFGSKRHLVNASLRAREEEAKKEKYPLFH